MFVDRRKGDLQRRLGEDGEVLVIELFIHLWMY